MAIVNTNKPAYNPYDSKAMNLHTHVYTSNREVQNREGLKTSGFSFKNGDLNGIMSVGGNVLGKALSGGMSSGVGNVMSGLGDIASAIPGPYGAAASAGLKVLGGITNALWGHSFNYEAINKAREKAAQVANTLYTSLSNDAIALQDALTQYLRHVTEDEMGKQGLFSNAVTNLTNNVNNTIDYSNLTAFMNRDNAINNVRALEQFGRNPMAFGGPLKRKSKLNPTLVSLFGEKDALELTNEWSEIKKELRELPKRDLTKGGRFGGGSFSGSGTGGRFTPVLDYSSLTFNEAFDKAYGNGESMFKYGEKYYNTLREVNPIREMNNRFIGGDDERSTLKAKDSYMHRIGPVSYKGLEGLPLIADDYPLTTSDYYIIKNQNKKAFGGILSSNGSNWSSGVTTINNGSTHELNPMGGVPMGVDNLGVPNFVEEGEVVYNDYVFSNRIKVPKKAKKLLGLSEKRDYTFAEASKYLSRESEERPNDPISKNYLNNVMTKLLNVLELIKQQRAARLMTKQLAALLQMELAMIQELIPLELMVQEEPQAPEEAMEQMPELNMFAEGGHKEKFTINLSLYGAIEEPFKRDYLSDLPELKQSLELMGTQSLYEFPTGFTPKGLPTPKKSIFDFDATLLRYAPVIGAALGFTNSLFDKPDYSAPNALMAAANRASVYSPVSYSPIGNYMQYNPFDREYTANKLRSDFAATNRALMNTSTGSRAAATSSLLAANQNYWNKLGDIYRGADEYNMAQALKVAEFNRGTNMANADMGLKASMANQEALARANLTRYTGIASALLMRDAIDARRGASMSANLSNFFTSLGNIGIDAHNRKDRDFYINHVAPNLPLAEIERLYGREAVTKVAKDRGISKESLKALGYA